MIRSHNVVNQNTSPQKLIGQWTMNQDTGSDSHRVEYNFNPGGTGRELIKFKDQSSDERTEVYVFHWNISEKTLHIVYDTNPATPVSIELNIVGDKCMLSNPDFASEVMLLFREGNLS
jgi:hypothetical protein